MLDNSTTSRHTAWTMTGVAQSMQRKASLTASSALGLVLFVTVILILPL
jgi:hypothetical protein